MLALPFYNKYLPAGGAELGDTVLRGTSVTVTSALGLVVLIVAAQVTRGFAIADAAMSRRLLGPPSDLAARVTELEIGRERVVDAAEAERRRIEHDLHDGAQQRLVALAMELGRAQAKFTDDPDGARKLVDQAHAQAKEALTELRNLVRGVHSPVLTERGLDAALSGLAALCPVPVDVHVDVPVRPKSSVEAVAYFVVAEALTNVAKHSRASHAKVVVEGHGYPGTLTVMISDDGIGGADAHGPGLFGLADRVSGVDGRLSVESPPAARRSSRRNCHAGSNRRGLRAPAGGADPAAHRGRARGGRRRGRRREVPARGGREHPGRGRRRRPDAAHLHRRGAARGPGGPGPVAGCRRARAVPVGGRAVRHRTDLRPPARGRLPAQRPGRRRRGVPRRAAPGGGGWQRARSRSRRAAAG